MNITYTRTDLNLAPGRDARAWQDGVGVVHLGDRDVPPVLICEMGLLLRLESDLPFATCFWCVAARFYR